MRKAIDTVGAIMSVLLSGFCALLCFSIRWMFATWNHLTMNELVFHLKAPLEGTNEDMVKEYIRVCALPALAVMFFVVVVLFVLRVHGKAARVFMAALCVFAVLGSGSACFYAYRTLDVGTYLEAQGEDSSFIEDYYVDPADAVISFPEKKRNLIYIFLESMEATYADLQSGGAFEENTIPELTTLAQENEDFSGDDPGLNGGYALTGTTWTMGAMFGHFMGLPLNIDIQGNDMDTQESFFKEAEGLGDILEKEGYSQTLLIGSEAVFGGRELFFKDHGNYDILDYTYAIKNHWIPSGYKVWWGYEDEKLFEFAREKLAELSAQEEPFHLTLLTVDTHFEDGYLCERCPDTFGDNQYANVMACSSTQVSEFVEWVKQQDFYENTTIVLVGDHPTMDSDFCAGISADYGRRVYTAFINSACEQTVTEKRTYSTFDFFPTTLAALGARIDRDRLGLGTNLYSSAQTLLEQFGMSYMMEELAKKSQFLEELAEIDTDSEELLRREEKIPGAKVKVGDYNRETQAFTVTAKKLTSIHTKKFSLSMKVWTQEDRSDLKTIPMETYAEGKYKGRVAIEDFGGRDGTYQVEVYLTDVHGTVYMLGSGENTFYFEE